VTVHNVIKELEQKREEARIGGGHAQDRSAASARAN